MASKTPKGHPMEIVSSLSCRPTVKGIVGHIERRVNRQLPAWQERLVENPGCLDEIELETLALGREIAGLLTVAALKDKRVGQSVKEEAETIRREAGLRKVYRKPRKVVLLCGLVLSMMVWYCGPRMKKNRRGAKRGTGKRGKDPVGLYPEWAALGIREGVSPELQSEVARATVLMPSIELAREELGRRGAHLDEKTVWRVFGEMGKQALAARKDDLEQWRRGELPAGDFLKDKRVAAAVDGGRARTRKNKKGKCTKKNRKRFSTPWREPKLLVIYVLDEKGKRDKRHKPLVDSTLLGPDHMMELMAFHLHQLGAAQAKDVIFLADGAPWIWNRVPRVIEKAGLDAAKCHCVLDLYHAMENVSKALAACKDWQKKHRDAERTRLKGLLKAGKADQVIVYLKGLRRTRRAKEIKDAIKYLEKRLHLMQYRKLRSKRLPIGSGAVESAIRRVINLRVKSPSIFWEEDNLESAIYLRAQALTGRWDEMLSKVREHSRRTRNLAWEWEATPMSIEDLPNSQRPVSNKVGGLAA